MTLILDGKGTSPAIMIKTNGIGDDIVFLEDCTISIDDFLDATIYVLTNTDPRDKDPRLEFIERVRDAKKIKGYNDGGKRLSV